MAHHARTLGALGVALLCTSGAAQDVLFSAWGTGATARLGCDVDAFGDLDGDGSADVLAGSLGDDSVHVEGGRAVVFSGDGSVLWETFGAAGELLGAEVAGVGDLDGDGHPDAAVRVRSAPAVPPDEAKGSVRVFSPHDDSLLFEFLPGPDVQFYGGALAGLGDTDGDGFNDLAVAVDMQGTFPDEMVRIHSGATGAVLRTLAEPVLVTKYGDSLDGVGDVNADGFADILVGASHNGGHVFVHSGQDGSVLHHIAGLSGSWFGWSVAGVGDLDDDGHADFAVGIPLSFVDGADGEVRVYSGASGDTLWSFAGDPDDDGLGYGVGGGGDVNGDGVPDVVAGASRADIPFTQSAGYDIGRSYVLSGVDGSKLFETEGLAGSSQHGLFCDIVGDADGDGYADVAIAAHHTPGVGGGQVGELRLVAGSPWADLEKGLGGADLGVPQLVGSGPLHGNDAFSVTLSDALPLAGAWLVIGFSELSAPFKGGRLVPSPDIVLPLATDAGGGFQLQAIWPVGVPPGTSVWWQTWVQDPGGPVGFTASNALGSTTFDA